MHLKNFSLIKQLKTGYVLAPAYDMVASALIVKGDTEELALHLNGKKRKIGRKDFDVVLSSFKILDKKAIENLYQKFSRSIDKWMQFISQSFHPMELKDQYKILIQEKVMKLGI